MKKQVITSVEVRTAVCVSQKQMLLLGRINFVCVRAHALVAQYINPISFGSAQQFLQIFMWRGNVWVPDDIIRRSGWRGERERQIRKKNITHNVTCTVSISSHTSLFSISGNRKRLRNKV